MRCQTVSRAKGKVNGVLQPMPREGSRLRKVYDLFQANKGRPVEFQIGMFGPDPNAINKLMDFYGLDIRRIRSGSSRVGRVSTWVLAGEWFGRVYVDYVADHVAASSTEEAA